MNTGFTAMLLAVFAIVAGRSAVVSAADKPLVVVTQRDDAELVKGLLGSRAEVKLLLPAGAATSDFRSIGQHVRSLDRPTMLILDLGRDDSLCRLWCERLQNNTGVPAAEVPRGISRPSSEPQRRIGKNIALAQLARQLSDRFPAHRTEIATNLTAMDNEASRSRESTLVSVVDPDSQFAP